MSTSHAELIRAILANRGTVDEHYHLCGLRSRASGGIQTSSPSTSRNEGQYSPSTGSLSSQNPPTTDPGGNPPDRRAQGTSTTRGSHTNPQQSTNTAINVRDTNQSVILLGVKGSRITLELAQIDTIKYGRDDLFFWTLKRQYKQCRGSLRYWLSIWRLSHCDFVKVSRLSEHVEAFSTLTSASSRRYGRMQSYAEAKIYPRIQCTSMIRGHRMPITRPSHHMSSRQPSLRAQIHARLPPFMIASECRAIILL